MITALIFATLALGQVKTTTLSCPITGEDLPANAPGGLTTLYNGASFTVCCAGCSSTLQKDPAKALADKKLAGKTLAVFLFDPVSGNRIDAKSAKATIDYKGMRYFFADAAEKTAFQKTMKTFNPLTEKEAPLVCPVSKEKIDGMVEAASYADYKGTRYYFCCPDCIAAFKKDSDKFAANVTAKKPVAVLVPAK